MKKAKTWYLTIQMKQYVWGEADLYVFYRIVRVRRLAGLKKEDEPKFVADDLKNPIGTYRFVVKNRTEDYIRATVDMMRSLLTGFDTNASTEPDEKFKKWLEKRED